MRLALLADIHANREAFAACLDDIARRGVDGYVLLGDYVGYGADPEWVVEQVRALADRGAPCVLGNHDAAILGSAQGMNDLATRAIEWTRKRLAPGDAAWLHALPLTHAADDRLFVHAEAADPGRWGYIANIECAARDLRAVEVGTVICGHVHAPSIYTITATEKIMRHVPIADIPIPLARHRRWHVVLGAVGQPRDRNPAAAYAILDDRRSEITFHRVDYDIESAARKILAAGLPDFLALRLFDGR